MLTNPRGRRLKLQLSNGYEADLGAFGRVLRAAAPVGARGRLSKSELAEVTGLSPVGAENSASLLAAMGIVQPVVYRRTPLGELVLKRDPFFEDLGTLWYMHYSVASNPRYLVWNGFATFVSEHRRFRAEDLRAQFLDLRDNHSRRSSTRHVQMEIRTVLNAYTRQAFGRLHFLGEDQGNFTLERHEPVPPLVLVACIANFRDREHTGVSALSMNELTSGINSPGRILHVPEDWFRATIESVKNEAGLSLESRGDLDQLRLTDETPDFEWMQRHYDHR